MKITPLKLEREENWVSKKRKILESVDKRPRQGNADGLVISKESTVNSNRGHVESSVMEFAELIRANLSQEFPSCCQIMVKSYVSHSLYLPGPVWKKLPNHDCTVVLMDENGKAYRTNYHVRNHTLDGGWKAFSTAHKLLAGDALVFHLIEFCKIKVYIVRALEVCGTPGPLNPSSNAKPLETDQSEHDCDDFGSDVTKSAKLSESISKFKDVKCFDDFKISVGDLTIDSEIPTNIREKYYDLCSSQKMFLHDHLIEGLDTKLAAVMISETVKIVDAIRAANLATSLHSLKCWDETLKGFEVLGLSVGFLRSRLHKLVKLSRESEANTEAKREKLAQLGEKKEALKASVLKIKESLNSLKAEAEMLAAKNEKLRLEFMELASAI